MATMQYPKRMSSNANAESAGSAMHESAAGVQTGAADGVTDGVDGGVE